MFLPPKEQEKILALIVGVESAGTYYAGLTTADFHSSEGYLIQTKSRVVINLKGMTF